MLQSPCPQPSRTLRSRAVLDSTAVGIIYWGVPRALCSAQPSHRHHLLAPLEAHGAAVRVFAHQFYRRDGSAGIQGLNVARSSDARRAAKAEVEQCLAPNASRRVLVEEQDDWLAALNISRYYGMSNRHRLHQWKLGLVTSYLCAHCARVAHAATQRPLSAPAYGTRRQRQSGLAETSRMQRACTHASCTSCAQPTFCPRAIVWSPRPHTHMQA